ncbi:MAG: hypothetical protein ACR2IS_03815, partial [Nitrososphaeraceae archaeon]
NYFVKNKQPTETFNFNVKARILSLGIDDYVGQVNNVIVRGDAARMVKEFKRDAYIKSLAPGGIDISANIYKDELFSDALSGITLAGYSFMKTIHKFTEQLK